MPIFKRYLKKINDMTEAELEKLDLVLDQIYRSRLETWAKTPMSPERQQTATQITLYDAYSSSLNLERIHVEKAEASVSCDRNEASSTCN